VTRNRPSCLAGRYDFKTLVRKSRESVSWLAVDRASGKTVLALAKSGRRAAALSRLIGVRHPHLASVLEVLLQVAPESLPVRVAGSVGVALIEHVEGLTAYERLREARMQPVDAALCIGRMAATLRVLQDAGAHHGAVCCENIILEPRSGLSGPVMTMLAPASGAYCSPERAAGNGPSFQDDVWALHAALFAALTGATPFRGTTMEAVQASIRAGQMRDLVEYGVEDPALRGIVERGLLLDAKARRSDAHELERALKRWLRRQGPTAGIPEHLGQARRSAVSLGSIVEQTRTMQPSRPARARRRGSTGRGPRRSGLRPGLQAHNRHAAPNGVLAASAPSAEISVELKNTQSEDDATGALSLPAAPQILATKSGPATAITVTTAATSPPKAGLKRRARWWFLALIPTIAVLLSVAAIVVSLRERWLPSSGDSVSPSATTAGPARPTAETTLSAPIASSATVPAAPVPAPSACVSARAPVQPAAAPLDLQGCVSSFFGEGSFVRGHHVDLQFLCDDRDFRGVNSLFERVLVSHGAGKVTPAMIAWSNLGWYQMAAAAVIRGRCCPSETAAIVLPRAAPPCDKLDEALQKIAQTPPTVLNADGLAKTYAQEVMKGVPRPYHYREPPGRTSQDEFVRFLQSADPSRDPSVHQPRAP
jgi:hypothetical protein